jgi:hypothetical protein
MKKFIDRLKAQAEENPLLALVVGAGFLTAAGKFIDAAGHATGSRAYARQVDNKIRNDRRR